MRREALAVWLRVMKRKSYRRPRSLVGRLPAGHQATGVPTTLLALEEELRRLMRQLADADSSSTERQREANEATRRLLLQLLDVNDGFRRVFSNVQSKQDLVTEQMGVWIGNFRAAHSLLEEVLADCGLVPLETLERGFDPRWHKVVEVVHESRGKPGTILEETKPGYMWQGHLLRKAEVVVVARKEPMTSEPGT
jgi:molecular chaperone GrpE (heat shock protein)